MSSPSEKKSVLVLARSNDDWGENQESRCGRIKEFLSRGVAVSDVIFDRIYPKDVSSMSKVNWTPVKIGILGARLLCNGSPRKVLDVGAGCGKFCAVAALSSEGRFTGVEQQSYLWSVAKETAGLLQAEQANFVSGNVFDLDWKEYDAFYFYNPFDYLNLQECVSETMARLANSRSGTRVLTYHGYGGPMPSNYALTRKISAGSGFLELWVKA